MHDDPVIGHGHRDAYLADDDVRSLVARATEAWDLGGARVLVIVPDATRTAPLPLFFRLLHEQLAGRVAALDYLVALGTHPPMSEDALNGLFGLTAEERAGRYADVGLFNHRWDLPDTLVSVGTITEAETAALSNGLLAHEVDVRVNRMLLDYDHIVLLTPVFPHEVAGFSGGNKYFFPGVSGPEVIHFTHWLGALITNYEIIGTKHTPVRAVINRAAACIDRAKHCFAMVVTEEGLHGLFAGTPEAAWSRAADLSAQVHITYVDRPYRTILSIMPEMYDDLWVGAKGMYKLEPVCADGGEVIIYAPHIHEVSVTHGAVLQEIGYHVRDYFVAQWDRFKDYPWGLLAHSTHVRGQGTFVDGVERPRVDVTLATGIPPEVCARMGVGYRDPAGIDPEAWMDREDVLVVPHAGQVLHRLRSETREHRVGNP